MNERGQVGAVFVVYMLIFTTIVLYALINYGNWEIHQQDAAATRNYQVIISTRTAGAQP